MSHIALITGGVTGIGAATAKLLQSSGYTAIANYYGNQEDAKTFHEETGIPVYEWNVGNFEECQDGAAKIAAEHGPIEILVNNAGITRDGTLHKMTEEQWRSVIDIDLGGCFNMCRAVIESMREKRFGRIVNISSVNGLSGQFGQTNYSAAKAGVIGFTKALALEGARRNITANAIAPGYTHTTMVDAVPEEAMDDILANVPVGRLGEPEEIARCVLFLVEDDAGFVTGSTLSVNGGKYMA
ncbi:acetoacetyl-CoA reductase [Altericroceibacterium spongiae]|uniref:Acetoacetyl-CoA reductase n=1 Tax=Altericroceibacterium spongiae TaxID=2320269 RepID=A0A420ECK5_9SPHN|nr:acetoacetyl-CoA reductase [Altericroceibacterium spongiae]RKF18393.1 acetoacetyl-CoA reductase [Altericroceibacterium spongiae]